MDLLATVRKEGSRGGRADFKWSDVQGSSHRENYLGHSLMAPVGRWQKGRDLNWYAKGDKDADENSTEDPAAKAARERKEEIQRVKQAEEDALARALGLPVATRNNPNMDELGRQREVGKMLKDSETADDHDAAASRGVGYGRPAGVHNPETENPPRERIEGTTNPGDTELQSALKEYRRRHGHGEQKHDSRRRHRSRSRSRDRDREYKRRRDDTGRHRESHRGKHRDQRSRRHSSSCERPLRRRSRSHSPSDSRNEASHHRDRRRNRSSERRDRGERGHHDDRRRYERP